MSLHLKKKFFLSLYMVKVRNLTFYHLILFLFFSHLWFTLLFLRNWRWTSGDFSTACSLNIFSVFIFLITILKKSNSTFWATQIHADVINYLKYFILKPQIKVYETDTEKWNFSLNNTFVLQISFGNLKRGNTRLKDGLWESISIFSLS